MAGSCGWLAGQPVLVSCRTSQVGFEWRGKDFRDPMMLGIILPSYMGIIINHYKDPY